MSPQERLKKLEELKRLKDEHKLIRYEPYPKQVEFHHLKKRERLLLAANRVGKTMCIGMEIAMHATGYYPQWWQGRRFARPVRIGVASETSELTRDGIQRMLYGNFGAPGTGTIPKVSIADFKLSRGTPEALEILRVKYLTGGLSEIVFKAFADGREKFQADQWDIFWPDEEPDEDIYTEGLTRTNITADGNPGMVMLSLTPLKGLSTVVTRFWKNDNPDRGMVQMTIEDAPHFPPSEVAKIVASYPPHEREARSRGIPIPGAGRIFPVPEESLLVDDFPIPDHWFVIGGLDFGWSHPAAAVKLAWDKEKDVIYVCADYRAVEHTPLLTAAAIKPWGRTISWAWPHDGFQHDKDSGVELAQSYRRHGLRLTQEHAQFSDERKNGVEAGLLEMLERMQTGRWKVFKSCGLWREEFLMYHRVVKEGRVTIQKLREDVISASRYAYMMLRYARPKQREESAKDRYRKPHLKWAGSTWMGT